jgi:hypothetical protein
MNKNKIKIVNKSSKILRENKKTSKIIKKNNKICFVIMNKI